MEEVHKVKKINIDECFEMFGDTFSPKIVGELNDQYVMLVRCEGDKVPWHKHDDEDEMFFVLDGVLEVKQKDKSITLSAGEFCVVPRNTEHKVVPRGHVKLMLFEPRSTSHTGKVKSEITKDRFDRLDQ